MNKKIEHIIIEYDENQNEKKRVFNYSKSQKIRLEEQLKYVRLCTTAYDRYNEIYNILVEDEDEKLLRMLDGVVNDAFNYVKVCVDYQNFLSKNLPQAEGKNFKKEFDSLETSRKYLHNGLISSANGFNRNLFKKYGIRKKTNNGTEKTEKDFDGIPVGGIVSLTEDKIGDYNMEPFRKYLGDWAGYLILGMYKKNHQIKK